MLAERQRAGHAGQQAERDDRLEMQTSRRRAAPDRR